MKVFHKNVSWKDIKNFPWLLRTEKESRGYFIGKPIIVKFSKSNISFT